jgi:hypothetical protein
MKKPEAKAPPKSPAKPAVAVKPTPDPRAAQSKPKERSFNTGRTEGICYTHERTKAQ